MAVSSPIGLSNSSMSAHRRTRETVSKMSNVTIDSHIGEGSEELAPSEGVERSQRLVEQEDPRALGQRKAEFDLGRPPESELTARMSVLSVTGVPGQPVRSRRWADNEH